MLDVQHYLPIAPTVLPLLGAGLCLLFWRQSVTQRRVAMLAVLGQLVASIALLAVIEPSKPLAVALGSWMPPFGIVFVIDILAATMTLLTAAVGLAALWYGYGRTSEDDIARGHYPLLLAMLAGVAGAFGTGDLFNLFVWFEVLLMASFVLLGFGQGGWRAEGAIKYLILNLVSSALFPVGVGLLYAQFGTLNMADLSLASMALAEEQGITSPPLAAWLLFIAFGIKAGLFPLYIWLPGAYHVPTPVISAVFAALLTKVGVYALIRLTSLHFPGQGDMLQEILVIAGLATMISGALGALAQQELRRILAFHVISQVGYMIVAVGLGTAAALAASLVYIVHHIVVKGSLFLVGGLVAEHGGTEKLKKLGGMMETKPWLAVLFIIAALSLAGVPPFSGFIGKLAVVQAGFAAEAWVVVGIALAGGLLTLLSMLKIWLAVFWGKQDVPPPPVPKEQRSRWMPAAALVATTVVIGVLPDRLAQLAEGAGDELSDPSGYIAAVEALRQPVSDAPMMTEVSERSALPFSIFTFVATRAVGSRR